MDIPLRNSLLIGLLVFAAVGWAWHEGWLQSAEWYVYDHYVVARSNPSATDSRIVIVAQTEHDIDSLDFPLRDKVLAQILNKIESGGPTVIGVDLYRDLAEPRDKSELAILQTAMQPDNIVAIFLTGSPFLIPPPPYLSSEMWRIGFNNLLTDNGKTVRRGCFYMKLSDGKQYNSFPALVAENYLAAKNIPIGEVHKQILLGKTFLPRFHSDDGGYVGANEAGYQFLLDLRGPTKFSTVTISDVLAMKDVSIFRDKIVLVGSTAQSTNDIDQTPLDKLDDYDAGVVVHAQVINQLLRIAINGDKATDTASLWFRWLTIAFWCLVGVAAGILARSYYVFAAIIVAGCAAIVLFGLFLFVAGYWTLVAAPMTAFLAASIFVKGYSAYHEAQQRAALMRLFSQRLSPEVAAENWKHRETFLQGKRPAAKRLIVTALFTDLKNYSTISEKMSPTELITWVNECTSTLAQHVGKNKGFISTYMGDGMMAVFGVPADTENEEKFKRDATSAVRCALSMGEEIKKMNARWRAEGRPLAGLRVGIFTGPAMTGYIGSDDHLEYSIIGDTINTASRLESVDKEGEWTGVSETRILIGEMTYRLTKDVFPGQIKVVGTIKLKGKTENTNVYKVLDSPVESSEDAKVTNENAVSHS